MSNKRNNLYIPGSDMPFKLSRSKIDLFLECPRCFYMDRRLGISRPSGPAFSLNVAVDALLKKEFDINRAAGTRHELMEKYGIDAVPVNHVLLEQWRHNFTGVQYLDHATNLLIYGAIDDLWQTPQGEYIVVDYKATSKEGEVELTDAKWHNSYRRQMEVYQWLLRHNGLKVSNTGYFVYVNGKKDRTGFYNKLDFETKLIAYTGSDSWVDQAIKNIYACLNQTELPASNPDCEFCQYRLKAQKIEVVKSYAS